MENKMNSIKRRVYASFNNAHTHTHTHTHTILASNKFS